MADQGGRRRALQQLQVFDATGLALVLDALGDEDPTVRREAVRVFARIPPHAEVLRGLERALTDEGSLARRSSAMEAVTACGAAAVPMLDRLAHDPQVMVRRIAVDALGMLRRPEALPVLERAARDAQAAVRGAALEGIARTGAPGAVKFLLGVVEERQDQASVLLAALLGLITLDETPAPATLKLLAADPLTAPPALRLLGRCGEANFLLDAVTRFTGSRQRAAVVGLADALDRGGALASVASPDAVKIIRLLVDSSDVHVAGAALRVAAHLGDVEVFAQAAARDDRAHLSSAAHAAARIIAQRNARFAFTLRTFAADDAPGAALLRELADAVDRRPTRSDVGSPRFDDDAFARLRVLLERAAGILVASDARVRLEARLLPRLEALNLTSFASYLNILEHPDGAAELQTALERVTVHETYFFRERHQLDLFRDEVVPSLKRSKNPGEPIRVWSAGTATGEEAWTLAIVLENAGANYEVVGTDLSREATATAQAARYTPRSFRGDIEAAIRKKWFIYELGGVVVHPELYPRTHFMTMNLLDAGAVAALPMFDVIFCRNVLIYMSSEARQTIVHMFWSKLKPGGLLFLGHSESLLHIDTPFRMKPLRRGLAFEKVATGDAS